MLYRFTTRKTKKHAIVKPIIDKDGNEIKDPEEKSNSFNDHFGTVGEKMTEKHKNENPDVKDPLN